MVISFKPSLMRWKGRFKGVVVLGGGSAGSVTLYRHRLAGIHHESSGRKIIRHRAHRRRQGGGKPDNARGGGKDASKLDEALAKDRRCWGELVAFVADDEPGPCRAGTLSVNRNFRRCAAASRRCLSQRQTTRSCNAAKKMNDSLPSLTTVSGPDGILNLKAFYVDARQRGARTRSSIPASGIGQRIWTRSRISGVAIRRARRAIAEVSPGTHVARTGRGTFPTLARRGELNNGRHLAPQEAQELNAIAHELGRRLFTVTRNRRPFAGMPPSFCRKILNHGRKGI